ncbi:KAP family P-loop NTPase fold protein, partial [Caldithrix abyssi]
MDIKINYIPDKEINIEKNDLLGAKPYVITLSEILKQVETPFTIGLFGGWGVGKSSIIKTLDEKFNNDKNSDITVFVYDAWKYSNDSFRRTFLISFLEFFNLKTKEIKSRFYTKKTQNTSWGISKIFNYQKAKSIIYDKTIEPEIFEGIFKESIQQITNNKNFSWKYFKEFIGFSRKIKKIVIVIDNIDRCHKDLAFELLLTIKNFLEQKGVVFIIPIDEAELKKYIKNMGYDPNEFLRKLFNTTIYIKSFSESDLFDFAKKLNDDYNLNFPVEVISIIAQQFSKNPRKIIQFLNVLQTELLLSEKQEAEELIPKGSITNNLTFFTKLLIVREEWPDL